VTSAADGRRREPQACGAPADEPRARALLEQLTLAEKLAWLKQQLEYEQITKAEHDKQVKIAREHYR
jgi:hypothetical protein